VWKIETFETTSQNQASRCNNNSSNLLNSTYKVLADPGHLGSSSIQWLHRRVIWVNLHFNAKKGCLPGLLPKKVGTCQALTHQSGPITIIHKPELRPLGDDFPY